MGIWNAIVQVAFSVVGYIFVFAIFMLLVKNTNNVGGLEEILPSSG